MLAEVVRSGVVESTHEGAVAVVEASGKVVAADGDIDRSYFIRSSAKPFQAMAALRAGAVFTPEELAIACASHGAQPIHVAYVERMLAADGLTEDSLQCPSSWPLAESSHDRMLRAGHRHGRRVWYNCSGKHAGMLRACRAAGWPLDTYLEPDHPFQVLIRRTMEEALVVELDEPGVDGCGAPVYRVTTRSLARGYATLATSSEYAPVRQAMERYGALTASSDVTSAPSRLWGMAGKGGAEGCFGVAVRDRFGVGIKSFDGAHRPLGPALLDTMIQLGVVSPLVVDRYRGSLAVDVFGGGEVVGTIESRVALSWT